MREVTARESPPPTGGSPAPQPVLVLAGDIAHELANLMVVIRGHTALLNNERHPGERAASLAAIDEASASAAKLTRQLRALTRMQQIDDRAGAAAA